MRKTRNSSILHAQRNLFLNTELISEQLMTIIAFQYLVWFLRAWTWTCLWWFCPTFQSHRVGSQHVHFSLWHIYIHINYDRSTRLQTIQDIYNGVHINWPNFFLWRHIVVHSKSLWTLTHGHSWLFHEHFLTFDRHLTEWWVTIKILHRSFGQTFTGFGFSLWNMWDFISIENLTDMIFHFSGSMLVL